MLLRWFFAALHLVALGVGFAAVTARRRALLGPLDPAGVQRVLSADNWWAVAAVLWVGTGLVRLLAQMEKSRPYYFSNTWFLAKMACFLVILALEIRPIVTFMRWRTTLRRGAALDTSTAPTLARVSGLQAALVLIMVLAAAAMARGLGARLP